MSAGRSASTPPDSYASRMARRPRWQRVLVPILLLLVVLVLPVGLGRNVIGAERVSIQVESCDNGGPKGTQRCRGTWNMSDGRVVSGPVGGGVPHAGDRVDGWANDDQATISLMAWLIAPLLVGSALLAAMVGLAVVFLRAGVQRVRRGR
ncbi:hypothetical protein [Micromonospora chokoriensis]|uniref:hypothetical protein n=1 Tax=Micromonospora chokoriensis TaxID=356851 RepID=UPI0012F784A9|nr:hypothetical protein [Micromonospora chokoriensis]